MTIRAEVISKARECSSVDGCVNKIRENKRGRESSLGDTVDGQAGVEETENPFPSRGTP
jgi:hypothetical protein